MVADQNGAYEAVPPIPTYDEAVAGGTAWEGRDTESQSLLHSQNRPGPSRRSNGYRQPTVETDDEDSDWTSEDDDETTQVRREIEELEIEEAEERRSTWAKRIPFSLSLSLPRWRWKWPFRIARPRIQLPSRAPAPDDSAEAQPEGEDGETRGRWRLPKLNATTVLLNTARILVLVLLLAFLYLIFVSDFLNGMARRLGPGVRPTLEELRLYLHNRVDEKNVRNTVEHFTRYAHVAGTEGDYALAEDVREMFLRAGLEDVGADEYRVYLNYPTPDGRAVEVLDDGGNSIWAAKLEEDDVGGEEVGSQTQAFHGYSKAGEAKGPLVYANYGSREDYRTLKDAGIETEGAIALVRYYGSQEDLSLKVRGAELAGFAGCIVYTDPADNGFKQGDVAPNGVYMPADGVQRGSVALSRWVLGDPLTPGRPSTKKAERIAKKDAVLPQIPSLPLSSRDAVNLLKRLEGVGQRVPRTWIGAVPDVKEWWTGDASGPIVRLRNVQDEVEKQPIWNVRGRITGIEQGERSVILGNHRDSFALGATDAHGGTAVLVELARIFGELRAKGWMPLRTIEFVSFDAKEYNMVGSTEYVEDNEEELRDNAYAYVNVGRVVSGTDFRASGSPVYHRLLLRVLDRMWDPTYNTTLRDLWNRGQKQLGGLGSDGDHVPFQTITGTSAIDLGFGGEHFPEGSSYNTFEQVDKHIDPGFAYHRLTTEIVGLMVLELADRYVLPFDMAHYASRLEAYVGALDKWVKGMKGDKVDLGPMKKAVKGLKKLGMDFGAWEMEWDSKVLGGGGWESSTTNAVRKGYNDRMALFETMLLDPAGVSLHMPLSLAPLSFALPPTRLSFISKTLIANEESDTRPPTVQAHRLRPLPLGRLLHLAVPRHPRAGRGREVGGCAACRRQDGGHPLQGG